MHKAFTLIELLVVISIIALLIAILLPALGAARRSSQVMQSNTQLRGIQQDFFTFAQSNKTWYPGMDRFVLKDPGASLTDASRIQGYNSSGSQAGGDVPARLYHRGAGRPVHTRLPDQPAGGEQRC